MAYPPARPRRRVLPFVVAVIVAAGLIVGLRWYTTREPGQPAACGGPAVPLRVAASQDKVHILRKVAADYNKATCAAVTVDEANSGIVMRTLARGWKEQSDGKRPDVWAPAGSAWVTLLRRQAGTADGTVPVAEGEPVPIMTSPLTIAMPQPMAEALGWPGKAIGWADLAKLAADPKGWARYGHPEWGAFKLGKTNPNFSTSGLNATIGAYFAATGTTGDLTVRDLAKPEVKRFVRDVERSIVHYGDITMTFMANLRRADARGAAMRYISAVTLEENSVTDYNRGNPSGDPATLGKEPPPRTPLAAIYPSDGTLYSDHPYVPLTWMDARTKAVAADFLTYLHSAAVQGYFQSFGYRTFDGKPGPLAKQEYGVLPNAKIAELAMPSAAVLEELLRGWSSLRKRANVLIVIDKSGSMEQEAEGTGQTRLELAKKAAVNALPQFRGDDAVGLWAFSTNQDGALDHRELVPLDPMSATGPKLKRQITDLLPQGGTGLYDTALAAFSTMKAAHDPEAINAVVFLTDGKNEKSGGISLDNLLPQLESGGEQSVRLFTIGFGTDADQETLRRIAEATDGAAYDSSRPDAIDQVFTAVISNF
ncbi:substrate-binding and VWA domain-containing protein [Nonomuraea sp. NPDC049152]|uniref:substrate-binding and VWA domain-containing protein n=1 Tax=Nonomuraea sp. NPDC049152 TaxID=3154350 RepID=UPI0033D8DF62